MEKLLKAIWLIFAVGAWFAPAVQAQTTAFTYQGKLSDGASQSPTSAYDLQFTLCDANGCPPPLPPLTITRDDVPVVNGVFTVSLDFGNAFDGAPRSLQIAVRRGAETGEYTVLAPLQPITSTPYAVRSLNALNADNAVNADNATRATNALNADNAVNALNAANAVNATNAANAANLGNVAAANYLLKNGDGSQLTNLPIRSLIWENITGATQAQANRGYITGNDIAQVVITLPASPVLGDIIRVTGAGAGGWRISQNANQTIAGSIFDPTTQWTPRDSTRVWRAVASSSDGTKLVAVAFDQRIYTSTDSGVTWTARDSVRYWFSVASSSDGTKLVAGVAGGGSGSGQLYTSTDSGVTWTARESARQWYSIASSADGAKLVAVAYGGQIYTSTDSGATWTARESVRNWRSVASSFDGTKLVAGVENGQIYTSTDSGVTWTARDSNRRWTAIASSVDGTRLIAASAGLIYTSTNSGLTWTPRLSIDNWLSVASSADGTKLVAVADPSEIYTSSDSGATWTARESERRWTGVASSSDGTKLVAVENGGKIYTVAYGATSTGAGFLTGAQNSAVELQYVGGGKFIILSSQGTVNLY